MKTKVLFFSTILLSLVMCKSPEEFREEDPVYHDMMAEAEKRDSAMLEMVKTINVIDESIGKITEKENILRVESANPEFSETNRQKIMREIEAIYLMMEENKNKIKQLTKLLAQTRDDLKKSNEDLKHANALIEQYQVMLDNLNAKIVTKDNQIAGLETELAKVNISLDSLKTEFGEQKEDLNRVYYAFGSKKELLESNVTDKEGGFIGIGKTMKLKSDFNRSFFTETNREDLKEIELYVKKVKFVTNHLDGSYKLQSTEDQVEKLIITDPIKFWESSKYLVLEVEQ